MSHFIMRRAVVMALAVSSMVCFGSIARADIRDYEFQLVDQAIKAGPDKIIAVRLMNKATGKPVPDAVIFATRLDMAPDGMAEMATSIAARAEHGARCLQVQGDLEHGRRLAAFAWRQGAR